jgi:hypothetical protein
MRTVKYNVCNNHWKVECVFQQRPKTQIFLYNEKIPPPHQILKPEKEDMSRKTQTYGNLILVCLVFSKSVRNFMPSVKDWIAA